jgi:Icc-related predicted phosphoesterase
MPGHVLEFIATKQVHPPVFVFGNHAQGYVPDPLGGEMQPPGGCINAHGRIIEAGGLLIAGFEGSGRYKPGPHQYSEFEYELMAARMTPRLAWNRLKHGRAVDILLTHAAPVGPHAGQDHPHRGIPAFNRFAERWQPRLHVHGHVHLVGANAPREYVTEAGVRVINAFDFTLIEL